MSVLGDYVIAPVMGLLAVTSKTPGAESVGKTFFGDVGDRFFGVEDKAAKVLEKATPWWWRYPTREEVVLAVGVLGLGLAGTFGLKTYLEELARYEAKKDCEDDG